MNICMRIFTLKVCTLPALQARSQLCEKRLLFLSYVSARSNSAPVARIVLKFDIWGLVEICRKKIQVSLKCDKNGGYRCTFMIIYDMYKFFFDDRSVYETTWKKHKIHCCISTATVVTRTLHNVTKYIHCRVLLVISVAQSSQKVPYKWSCPLLFFLVWLSRPSFWSKERSCVT
jgi:hypothetical protein